MIIVGGDLNAHIPRFDGKENHRGRLLQKLADEHRLRFMNESVKCVGKFTRRDAVIYFMLVNENAEHRVNNMLIDDKRYFTGLSDHNLIILGMAIPRKSKPRSRWESTLDTRKAVDVVNNTLPTIDFTNTDGYKMFRQVCTHAIASASKLRPATRGKQWAKSAEVRRLTEARRESNRAWRKARKEKCGEEEARQAYKAIQDELRKQVAIELERENEKLMSFVLKAPRHERAIRFWRLVNKNRSTDGRHMSRARHWTEQRLH